MSVRGPLAGLRVAELADTPAAAFCAKILADLGAHVTLVEPVGGHPARHAEPRRADGLSARFAYLNTNKASAEVPATPEGDERLRSLLDHADVLVTDAEPDRVDALGSAHPGLVVVGVRPFGASGPDASRPAHHLTVFHSGGEGSLLPSGLGWQLFPDRAPIQLGSEIAWFDAGWNAAVAALAASFELLRAGTAQRVDVSAQESQLTLNRTRLSRFNNDGVTMGREPSRYAGTGMLATVDGWIQLVGMRDEHWERLLARPDGESLRDERFTTAQGRAEHGAELTEALHAWCRSHEKAEVVRILAEVGAPVGAHRTPAELLECEQLAHRGFFHQVDDGRGGSITLPGVPYRFSRTSLTIGPAPDLGGVGSRRADTAVTWAGPKSPSGPRLLEGVRILDFTWAAAGPYATLLLALMGADVIKVESAARPDPARRGFLADYGGINRSPNFSELNLNKRSIEVDLTRPEGIEAVRQLIGQVDVVVDNFRPGVMARFGFGPDDLLAEHPSLVVASSSANGSTGPLAMAAGFASVFGATGGLSEQTGYVDGPPTEVGESTDYRSANALAVGIIAALAHATRTGEGQHVDVASGEVVVASAPDALLAHVVGAAVGDPQGQHPSDDGATRRLSLPGTRRLGGRRRRIGRRMAGALHHAGATSVGRSLSDRGGPSRGDRRDRRGARWLDPGPHRLRGGRRAQRGGGAFRPGDDQRRSGH